MSGQGLNPVSNSLTGKLINPLRDGHARMDGIANLKRKQVFKEKFEGGKTVIELW